MLQLKLSYGTEKISCLMSRHYLVNRLTNDQRSKSLLSDSAGMQARDLLKLYMELENEFHIDFNPLVLDGNFDKYDCLLGYIVRKTGEKNVN